MAKKAMKIDVSGFERMINNISPENRKGAMKYAMSGGAQIVQKRVRNVWKRAHQGSDLDQAILYGLYDSGEGAVIRRHYVKGGMGRNMNRRDPKYRSYILNFFENGTKPRQTKGKIGSRWPQNRLNRGLVKALGMFRKGANSTALNQAMKEIERRLLVELAKQARK